ncbi:hypothetical protein [Streptomyces mirabilis]
MLFVSGVIGAVEGEVAQGGEGEWLSRTTVGRIVAEWMVHG